MVLKRWERRHAGIVAYEKSEGNVKKAAQSCPYPAKLLQFFFQDIAVLKLAPGPRYDPAAMGRSPLSHSLQ